MSYFPPVHHLINMNIHSLLWIFKHVREGALKGQHIILPDTRAEKKKQDQLVGSSTAINWLGWVANWYIKVKLVSLVHGPQDQTEFLLRAESTFSRQ